ncbi:MULTISPECIES: methionyl-tRNA formyltransferase [unclassified Microbacterium]|uniref:methionyl-tRNA formyltransferase n=1 Tax=unclassified Microbacterium TaxID=2609290 RepID=UPI0023DB9952|nr:MULTISPECIES: methionyl-tRNA formyltransferase [unclassified Microbacterium]MDF2046527.1 methionyl-tRNA formyltransferase [Microbacterium sp. Kw_RZR3]MDQ1077033.1 methionyl-tRNA formyltransferase [Microbacterium sp. SORGH_AS_0969]
MRLVFAGTPAVAVPSLRALASGPHEIAAVVTRGDAPLGRKRVLTPSPVAQAAVDLGLPVIKADRLDAETTERITALEPDLGVIVAYGGLVREPLLTTPTNGWINLHFSLLPRWRGAAPVQRALIAGDTVTGASVFQLVAALDAGDVFAEERYEIPGDATAAEVLDDLAGIGAPLLARVVDAIAGGTAVSAPQQGEPTLAPKLTLEDGALDFTQDADVLLHRIAGVTPEPGAHTTLDGARFKVLRAVSTDEPPLPPGRVTASGKNVIVGTGSRPLRLVTVQPAGKGAMAAGDWFRGLRTSEPVLGA